MPRNRPSLKEILERVYVDFESGESGVDPRNRGSVQNAVCRAIAGASHAAHGAIDYDTRQAIPITATDTEWIEWHASMWLDNGRKPAAKAYGLVDFTGTDGSTIIAGTGMQRADGVQFVTDAEVTIAAGVAQVSVTAVEPGIAGITAGSTKLTLVSPVVGVNSTVTADAAGLTNGADAESDARLLERVLERIRNPIHGGKASDYVAWAKEVAGVTRAWVYPREMGIGTVTVRFVVDDDPAGPFPDAAKVAEVLAHIDAVCPEPLTDGYGLYVVAPIEEPLDITITGLNPSTQAVKDAIAAELADLLSREAEPAGNASIDGEIVAIGGVIRSHLNEAISIATGEYDHELTIPAANVTHTTGKMASLGTISYA